MLFGYLTLATALIISLSAAVYSILGLTAIFAAAFWPIVIMGGSLEFGKIITTLWLHKYWDRAEIQYKVYLCSAVAILMLLTSMGVFGFLSKAHTDQSLVSGDVGAKIAIYDEKIKISRENIDANRRALKQLDEAVDQVMSRSTTEGGADKAVAIRRSQATERGRLLKEIEAEQKKITALNEERAPIAADVRKVEAEVGPIKYIAALVYGDNPDANVLEKSVRWVIILIVVVFDPLALTLLLAATKALEWEKGINIFEPRRRQEEEEEQEQADKILRQGVANSNPNDNVPVTDDLEPVFEREEIPLDEPVVVKEPEKKALWAGFGFPMSSIFNKKEEPEPVEQLVIDDGLDERPGDYVTPPAVVNSAVADEEDRKNAEAAAAWKKDHPDQSVKYQRRLHELGRITELPWQHPDYHPDFKNLGLQADNVTGTAGEVKGFGTTFPTDVVKGDMYLRVDRLPSALYKFNGTNWIEVDKALSDQYAYDEAYIDHLIAKIDSGEYDPELLSDAERDSIEHRLTKTRV